MNEVSSEKIIRKIFLKFKENIYLLIPIITTLLWALACVWFFREQIISSGYYRSDLLAFRSIGYYMVYDPSKNYPGQWYMPITGYFFFIAFTIWPIPVAHWICFMLNYVSAVLILIEFNKILKIMGIKEKFHRFLFLIIPANGWIIFWQFQTNSYKYITGFIILLILRREIKWNLEERSKNLMFYLINYGLFLFILSWAPYLIFFLILYVFYNIRLRDLFKRRNVKKYFILIGMFVIQNMLFFIYPYYFYIFLTKGLTFSTKHFYMFLVYSRVELPTETMQLISNIFSIILLIISLFIAFIPKVSIQRKFTYFSFFYILFGTFRVYYSMVFLIPLMMLALIPFFIQENFSLDFIKKNLFLIIGLISLFIYCVYPTTAYGGLLAMILLGAFTVCVLILHVKSRDQKRLFIFPIIFIILWSIYTYLMFTWFYTNFQPNLFI